LCKDIRYYYEYDAKEFNFCNDCTKCRNLYSIDYADFKRQFPAILNNKLYITIISKSLSDIISVANNQISNMQDELKNIIQLNEKLPVTPYDYYET
jgi:hypothetical protein